MINEEKIYKYISGDASQEEKEEFQHWLEADPKNRKEYMALRTLYDISLGQGEEEKNSLFETPDKRKSPALWNDILKIAAIILITFSITYYFLSPEYKQDAVLQGIAMQTLYVPAGQRSEIILSDGTKVYLNAQTTFIFPERFSEFNRDVFIDGEGYFEVTHSSEKPFTVNTSRFRIHVLGTEFNVTAYSKNDYFETSLINGSVEIQTKDLSQKLALSPGDQAFWETERLVKRQISHYDHFLWTKGILSFDQERIEDILNKLEIYYDIEINNRNEKIKDMRYTGKFRTKYGIDHVLNVLRIPTGLKYTKDNEKNSVLIQ